MDPTGWLCLKLPSESQLLTKLTEHIHPLGQELSMTHLWIPQAMPLANLNKLSQSDLAVAFFSLSFL